MTKKTIFIPLNLRPLNNTAKLSFYDNPWNFYVEDCRGKTYKWSFPENTLITLTHATYWVSGEVRRTIKETKSDVLKLIEWAKILRLVKNFSDFWTRKLIKASWIPKKYIIINKASRLIWDANRSTIAPDFVRNKDFNWIEIISNPDQFRFFWEDLTWEYHNNIFLKLRQIEKEKWWVIGFDIHDTWVRLMEDDPKNDKFRDWGFPLITLWSRNWESCNPEILNYFAQRLKHYLWIESYINDPYNWWYVVKLHWEDYRKENNTKRVNMIQVEFWRFMYMKESTQEIDLERMKIIWEWLKRAVSDTWHKFSKEYFEAWNFWNDYKE